MSGESIAGLRGLLRDWLSLDSQTRAELIAAVGEDGSKNHEEMVSRFGSELEFRTGGLRGVMGAGLGRMNQYTVGRATSGLADYLIETGGEAAKTKGVVIGYDTRLCSESFAQVTADVLSLRGIRVYLMRHPIPTPELSFAVRHLCAAAGVMITASHNPREYNGYKVYNGHGGQMVPEETGRLIYHIKKISGYGALPAQGNSGLINNIGSEVDGAYYRAVLSGSLFADREAKGKLKVVYSPLHGAGMPSVTEVLERAGFVGVAVVKEQAEPDGNFPTINEPNPEKTGVLDMAIALAKRNCADIALATDADADRVGVAVREKSGEYALLSGNQIGALLVDFCLSNRAYNGKTPVIAKTVVTGELGARVAADYGAAVLETLTGFKYIGALVEEISRGGIDGEFVVGYEESFGYLTGNHCRDKDGVSSVLIICEMAAFYKRNGLNLCEVLDALYSRHGYFADALETISLRGGFGRAEAIMERLRRQSGGVRRLDYKEGICGLPKENMLKYLFDDGSWAAVRPSGTEPKLKVYYSAVGTGKAQAEEMLAQLKAEIAELVNGAV